MSEEYQNGTPEAADDASNAADALKKRGRPSLAEQEARETAQAAEAARALKNIATNAPRRRGRPSRAEQEARAAAQTAMEHIVQAPRGRGRPSNADKAARAAALAAIDTLSGTPRRRGRPSKAEQQAREEALAAGAAAIIDVLPTVLPAAPAMDAEISAPDVAPQELSTAVAVAEREVPVEESFAAMDLAMADAFAAPETVLDSPEAVEPVSGPEPVFPLAQELPETAELLHVESNSAAHVALAPAPGPIAASTPEPEILPEPVAGPISDFATEHESPQAASLDNRKNKRRQHRHGGKSKAAKAAARASRLVEPNVVPVSEPTQMESPAATSESETADNKPIPATVSTEETRADTEATPAATAVEPVACPEVSDETQESVSDGEEDALWVRTGKKRSFHFAFWPTIVLAYICPALSALTVIRPDLAQYFDTASALTVFGPVGVLIFAVILYFALYEKHYYLAKGFLWGAIVSVVVPVVVTLVAFGSCLIRLTR